ncbi:hypothetical protein IMCC1989_1790 [gamma proteobacterium IMCC1989]|nr:hypothetical protein IMCC1989_1790 [gamma proteobacterium IMCC1989]
MFYRLSPLFLLVFSVASIAETPTKSLTAQLPDINSTSITAAKTIKQQL